MTHANLLNILTKFALYEEMVITKVTLKELIYASKTKASLSGTLGEAVLEAYAGSAKKVVVIKGTTV